MQESIQAWECYPSWDPSLHAQKTASSVSQNVSVEMFLKPQESHKLLAVV